MKTLLRRIAPASARRAYGALRRTIHRAGARPSDLRELECVPGFLSSDEGLLLYRLARQVSGTRRVVELGSWLGRSTVFLAAGIRDRSEASQPIIAVDHHAGSPEHQQGQADFDPITASTSGIDTFDLFSANLRRAKLREWVDPWRCDTVEAATRFSGTVGLLFVDAAHEMDSVAADVAAWQRFLDEGSVLCFHDVDLPGPATVALECQRHGYTRHVQVGSLLALRRC